MLIILSLTACQGPDLVTSPTTISESTGVYPLPVHTIVAPTGASYPTPEPFPFPPPEAGSITIHGTLVAKDPFFMAPDPEDPVFLVPLSGDESSIVTIPPFEIGSVPRAKVDIRNGEFVFTGIQPGQYAIVVLLATNAQVPAKFLENDNLAIITLTQADLDQVVEVGFVSVP